MNDTFVVWTGPTELDKKLGAIGISMSDIERAECSGPNSPDGKKLIKGLKKLDADTAQNRALYF